MSTSDESDFIKFDMEIDSDSLRESNSYHSTKESTPTEACDTFDPLDYWFGKRYFECIVAQHLLPQMKNMHSSSAIDSLFESCLRTFSYDAAFQELQLQENFAWTRTSPRSPNDVYADLMGLIGNSIRNGTQERKQRVIVKIRQLAGVHRNSSADLPTSQQGRGQNAPNHPSLVSTATNEVDSGISRYTTVLKEKGDELGVIPIYETHRVTPDTQLPVFRAIVVFQGHRFEGSGRSKYQAKHQASKEACQFFNF